MLYVEDPDETEDGDLENDVNHVNPDNDDVNPEMEIDVNPEMDNDVNPETNPDNGNFGSTKIIATQKFSI